MSVSAHSYNLAIIDSCCMKSFSHEFVIHVNSGKARSGESDSERLAKEQKIREYKQWAETVKTSNRSSGNSDSKEANISSSQVSVSQLIAKMEERRRRWMQECTPWR